ncbi:MAG: VIT1/CCC1 transporter family protein [Candidatus Omnitrophica bacterium]|nr:VIT1/CCC1 transporter family protein [Candidatus Omnitrophota bacterium]
MSDHLRTKIRDTVFGTQDGLVSTLGALTGIAAGTQSEKAVIIAGFVIVAVESLSMAAGTYLSSKSQRQYLQKLLDEEWQSITDNPEHERQELLEMYRRRGFEDHEIDMIARRLFSNKQWLLEDMAHKELGISIDRLEEPVSNAFVMGISYVIGGGIPVLPYFFLPLNQAMPVSMAGAALGLFALGGAKGKLVNASWWISGLEMLLVAGLAAAIGYLIGSFAKSIVGFI